MITTSREDICWVAGLLEGEGTFNINHGNATAVVIKLTMTDRDIVERAAKILGGTGNVRHNKGRTAGHKDIYTFGVYGSDLAVEWMQILYPLMGIRRQAKFKEIFDYWSNRRTRSQWMTEYNKKSSTDDMLEKLRKLGIEDPEALLAKGNRSIQ